MTTKYITLVVSSLSLFVSRGAMGAPMLEMNAPLIPVIVGDWWPIAGNPDLGPYTTEKQQPVDFAVWQAADGTWQLWSCIRNTAIGGVTRLLHGWEGASLMARDWTPKGVVWTADAQYGEEPGGMQAPHVVRHDGCYWMAYGDWNHICFATSEDGKSFTRVLQPGGVTGAFSEGPGANTRDAMLINLGGLWHCYYTAFPGGKGYVYCRTSPDLENWGLSCVVCYGGTPGNNAVSCECPHAVEPEPGLVYLSRTQHYGEKQRSWVYCSRNPLNFGIDSDAQLVRSLPVAAPEIVHHEGEYYIAALNAGLDGIRMAKLAFVPPEQAFMPLLDLDEPGEGWTVKAGNLPQVFSVSKGAACGATTKHFIGTAESGAGLNDNLQCIIESPTFTIDSFECYVLVSGGNDARYLYVALIDAWSGDEIARVTGHNGEVLRRALVPCGNFVGHKAYVRIVDHTGVSGGHINFGGVLVMRPEYRGAPAG